MSGERSIRHKETEAAFRLMYESTDHQAVIAAALIAIAHVLSDLEETLDEHLYDIKHLLRPERDT